MNINKVLILLALICFLAGAFGIAAFLGLLLVPLGLALLAAAQLV